MVSLLIIRMKNNKKSNKRKHNWIMKLLYLIKKLNKKIKCNKRYKFNNLLIEIN